MNDHRWRNVAGLTLFSFDALRSGYFEKSFCRAVTKYCESLTLAKFDQERPAIGSFSVVKK